MRRILEQCMVKLQLKIDYNYRGENLEFGSLGFYLHIHAYCTSVQCIACVFMLCNSPMEAAHSKALDNNILKCPLEA